MSVKEITAEETGKIAGILETKWSEMSSDNTRLTAENESLNVSLDLMTQDRNYWRERAETRERERDRARTEREYMLQQWLGVIAIAEETKNEVLSGRISRTGAEQKSATLTDAAESELKRLGAKYGGNNNPTAALVASIPL
jgi:hypothetical protein